MQALRRLENLVPLVVAIVFWTLALLSGMLSGTLAPLLFFGYLGSALPIAVGMYLRLPCPKRVQGRRWLLFVIGSGLLVAAWARACYQQQLVQVEGLCWELFSGIAQAAVLHYLIAKILGPLLFGRIYCGWACWTAMVLDFLPFKRSPGRRAGIWPWLRYLHLGLSVALVAGLWFGMSYRPGPADALAWFIGGNLLYYALGIGIAYLLRDNRAFCKYLCPAGLLAKPSAQLALIKVVGNAEHCNQRCECSMICPMDILVSEYVQQGRRVMSSECILCQACVNVCPEGALSLSIGIDLPSLKVG
jgi:ferredoxin